MGFQKPGPGEAKPGRTEQRKGWCLQTEVHLQKAGSWDGSWDVERPFLCPMSLPLTALALLLARNLPGMDKSDNYAY